MDLLSNPINWQLKFSISDDDLALLNLLNKHVDQHFAQFMKDLSLWLTALIEPSAAISAANLIDRHYRCHLFPKAIDQHYVEAINKLGKEAVAQKISSSLLNSALSFLTRWWLERVDFNQEATRLVFIKMRVLDIALIFDIYRRAIALDLDDKSSKAALIINQRTAALEKIAQGEMNFMYEAISDTDGPFKNAMRDLIKRLHLVIDDAKNIAEENFITRLETLGVNDELGAAFVDMSDKLRELQSVKETKDFIKRGLSSLDSVIKGEQNLLAFAQKTICFLCRYLEAMTGTFYIVFDEEGEKRLRIVGVFVANSQRTRGAELSPLENPLINQAMSTKKMVVSSDAAWDHLSVSTVFGCLSPKNCAIFPIIFDGEVTGILEIASYKTFPEKYLKLAEELCHVISSSINIHNSRSKIRNLLEQSKAQTLKLEIQEEKLKKSHEALKNLIETRLNQDHRGFA